MQRLTEAVVPVTLAALLSVLASPGVSAQSGHFALSMEWQVARSDVVVRATIAKILRDQPHEQSVHMAVTLETHETLKGKKADSLTYLVVINRFDKRYEVWRDAKRELLVFLVNNKDYRKSESNPTFGARWPLKAFERGAGWNLLRLGPPVSANDGWGSLPIGVFDMKLNVATSPEQILNSARRAASFKQGKKKARSYKLWIPRRVMQCSGASGIANAIIVPIDSRLETLAQELASKPREILTKRSASAYKTALEKRLKEDLATRLKAAKTEEKRQLIRKISRNGEDYALGSLREGGAKALRFFKSKENIGLLKPLLHDDSFYHASSIDGKTETRVWFVRKAAYETLTAWRVKVEKPTLAEIQ